MNKYIFDTTAYSHLVKGHPVIAELTRQADIIYMPSLVLAELSYGFHLGNKRVINEQLLNRFISNNKVQTLLPDHVTTDYFVNIAVFARKKGVQLSSHDIWIAALAEQWQAILVSLDNDFRHLDYTKLKRHPIS